MGQTSRNNNAIEAKIQPSTSSPSPSLSPSPEPSSHSSGLDSPSSTSTNDVRSRKMARSSEYERLEGGMGPSKSESTPKKRFGWKRFALGAAIIIGVVYFLGPRETSSFSWKSKDKATPPPPPHNDEVLDVDPITNPTKTSPDTHEAPATTHAGPSYESDPNPSKTTHCFAPYNSNSNIVQYALMIDAGSTGSRIHIYKFNNCGPSPEYEYEVFKMTQPGLSSFAGNSAAAAESLDILLNKALRIVPKELRKCTPVAVKATAGLRLLPGSQSADILAAVESRIRDKYPFPLPDKDGVVIMDGKDEGVYAWITANYLLNTIRADTPKDTPTYAVLDLGGASTQIVFEPVFASDDMKLEEGEHKYDLLFGGRTHVLYQHSYLGYGLMRARQHVHQLVDFMESIRPDTSKEGRNGIVGNPCLAQGTRRKVEITDEVTGTSRSVEMDGETIGSFEACDRILQLVLAKDAICEMKPCSFNGVYQPSLLDSFPAGKVLLLSYFYDRLFPLLTPDTPITVSTIAATAQSVCKGRNEWLALWGAQPAVMEELADRPEWCLDLTFMHALLRLGYEFEDTRQVALGKQIEGTELGWCLGATIAMVGGDLKCRM